MRFSEASRRVIQACVAFAIVAGLAMLAGCLQPVSGPVVRKRGIKRSFRAPNVKPVASEDGTRFTTPHFVLQFSEGMEEVDRYRTKEDRAGLALGKLVQLEALYNFLDESLGLKIQQPVQVLVVPRVGNVIQGIAPGYSTPAFVRARLIRVGKEEVAIQSQAVFSVEALSSPGTLAHEITHALENASIGLGTPPWFSEGLAVMVEKEFLGDSDFVKRPEPIGLDDQGRALLQSWAAHRSRGQALPKDLEYKAYEHAYYIFSELRDRYGDQFFPRLFALLRPKSANEWTGERSDSELVALMSEAAGQDLTPFFRDELHFALDPVPTSRQPQAAPQASSAPIPAGIPRLESP